MGLSNSIRLDRRWIARDRKLKPRATPHLASMRCRNLRNHDPECNCRLVVPPVGITASPLFALTGQPHVSLGRSAATPQDLMARNPSSPERAAHQRRKCRPFRACRLVAAQTQGGRYTASPMRSALADMGLPLQGEESVG